MNRQQQRRVKKLTNQDIKEIEHQGMMKGIQGTLNIVYETMNEEFGFGKKRLDRLEEAILNKLRGMTNV